MEGLRNLKTVGTFSRSSRFVSKSMLRPLDLENSRCIVELGAGDGPITKHILKNMHPEAKLFSFEINDYLYGQMTDRIDDKRFFPIHDDAQLMGDYIRKEGFEQIDQVISAIPFVLIPDDTIIKVAHQLLKPGGKYVQLHYSTAARRRYKRIFGNTQVRLEPRNLPPAFIHICEKE